MASTEDYITRHEHDEFVKRMEESDKRQNHRLEVLEESVKDIGRLATSIEKIAINQEHMLKEQTRQGELLDKAQNKIDVMEKTPLEETQKAVNDAKKKVVDIVITVVVTALVIGLIAVVATYVSR